MIEVELKVGSRNYRVACKPGEEAHLQSAAALLDAEAQQVSASIARAPESQILLLAGLMLGDKMSEMEWRLKSDAERLKSLEDRLRGSSFGSGDSQSRSEISALKKELRAVSAELEKAQNISNLDSNSDGNDSLARELEAEQTKSENYRLLALRMVEAVEKLAK